MEPDSQAFDIVKLTYERYGFVAAVKAHNYLSNCLLGESSRAVTILYNKHRWVEPKLVDVENRLEEIAARKLRVMTLRSRGRERLDFYNLNVNSIKEALLEAYTMGVATVLSGK